MSATKFWILTVMAVAIAMLVGLEIVGTKRVSSLTDNISDLQMKNAGAQRQQESLRQLVQRIVNDSRNDPALAEMLARNGVKVTANPPAPAPAPEPAPAPATGGKLPKTSKTP